MTVKPIDRDQGPNWQAYGKVDRNDPKGGAVDLEAAVKLFRERYGTEPQETRDGLTCWLVGPIDEQA